MENRLDLPRHPADNFTMRSKTPRETETSGNEVKIMKMPLQT
jgi:hypothetical protein